MDTSDDKTASTKVVMYPCSRGLTCLQVVGCELVELHTFVQLMVVEFLIDQKQKQEAVCSCCTGRTTNDGVATDELCNSFGGICHSKCADIARPSRSSCALHLGTLL